MRGLGLTTETFYNQLLKSCNVLASLKQIHSSLTALGLINQAPHLVAHIIIKYTNFGKPNTARSLFNNFQNDCHDSFLWNTMIRAYVNSGHVVETLELYSLMRRSGVSSNNYTFPFVLKACASKSLIREGKVVHADVIRTGFQSDLFVDAALVDMYAKCGQTDDGCYVFEEMSVRDLVSWTAMITAYEQAGKPEKAIILFQKMQQEGLLADSVTIVSVASAVGQLGDVLMAQAVHGLAICSAFLEDLNVQNSIVTMYARCGNVDKAHMLFDMMKERDLISWNSMLSGYVKNSQASEAVLLFDEMQHSDCKPNHVTALILVTAFAYFGSHHLGRKFHDYIVNANMKIDATLRSALMDMYAKCGDLETAENMFNDMHLSERNVSSWNVLIAGYGMHGHGRKALEFFTRMLKEGVKPDHITFTSILSACSHAGLIDEGRECFADMCKLSVKPEVKHYACMVDMLGRAGCLDEAFLMIKQMPLLPNVDIWGALLLACRIHGNTELGEIAAENLFQQESGHAGYYVLMSNIYAASNKWNQVAKLRQYMKNKGLKKSAAFSVIEFGNEILGFHTADQVNPYWKEVDKKVESMAAQPSNLSPIFIEGRS